MRISRSNWELIKPFFLEGSEIFSDKNRFKIYEFGFQMLISLGLEFIKDLLQIQLTEGYLIYSNIITHPIYNLIDQSCESFMKLKILPSEFLKEHFIDFLLEDEISKLFYELLYWFIRMHYLKGFHEKPNLYHLDRSIHSEDSVELCSAKIRSLLDVIDSKFTDDIISFSILFSYIIFMFITLVARDILGKVPGQITGVKFKDYELIIR